MIAADRKYTAHFEHTVALTKDGPLRLTAAPNPEEAANLPEWLANPNNWVVW
jgi:hypothetical protein